jgi:predicted SprT family Zn-dependent metalloprotease
MIRMALDEQQKKPKTPTREQFAAYERLYAYFNRELFAGELAPCVLNFSRHANTLGFFAPDRWSKGDTEVRHEISLNPATLKLRTPREVCSTLVHEMVHLWQHERGTPSRAGYHNREWSQKMEAVGLMPSTTGQEGGEKVGQRMTHYVIDGGAFALAFERLPHEYFPWLCASDPEGARKKKTASKVRYTCPECDAHVWGKPGLAIRCNECREDFDEDPTDA